MFRIVFMLGLVFGLSFAITGVADACPPSEQSSQIESAMMTGTLPSWKEAYDSPLSRFYGKARSLTPRQQSAAAHARTSHAAADQATGILMGKCLGLEFSQVLARGFDVSKTLNGFDPNENPEDWAAYQAALVDASVAVTFQKQLPASLVTRLYAPFAPLIPLRGLSH